MTTTRPVPDVLWGQHDDETFSALTPDEAIEQYLDEATPFPPSVTVVEYKRAVLTLEPEQIIEWIDDNLREEYQHRDVDDGWDPPELVHKYAAALASIVKEHYLPTVCDATGNEVTVDTADWVREHRPGWLGKNPVLVRRTRLGGTK